MGEHDGSHPLIVASDFFGNRGLSLSDKARRSVAVGVGLAGSIEACDDAFLSVGLRRSNSVLALLTDKYRLDFSQSDQDAEEYLAARDQEEIEVDLEMYGYTDEEIASYVEHGNQILEDTLTERIQDAADYEEHTIRNIERLLADEQVLSISVRQAFAERNRHMDTFALTTACSECPETALVLRRHKLSPERIERECKRYQSIQASKDAQQIVLSFDQGRIKVRTFDLLDGYRFDERQWDPERLIVQLSQSTAFVSTEMIQEFEDLVNWKDVSERDIQDFLSSHPTLLMGDQYRSLHSQLILDNGDKGDLIPDFFAELTTDQHVDIIDLKKPNEALMVGRRNRRGFSAAVNSAINQLRTYRDYFDDPRRRAQFYERYGLRAFKPRIAVIIGRSPPGSDSQELIEARRSLSDAEVLTFDDIIERARRRQLTIKNP